MNRTTLFFLGVLLSGVSVHQSFGMKFDFSRYSVTLLESLQVRKFNSLIQYFLDEQLEETNATEQLVPFFALVEETLKKMLVTESKGIAQRVQSMVKTYGLYRTILMHTMKLPFYSRLKEVHLLCERIQELSKNFNILSTSILFQQATLPGQEEQSFEDDISSVTQPDFEEACSAAQSEVTFEPSLNVQVKIPVQLLLCWSGEVVSTQEIFEQPVGVVEKALSEIHPIREQALRGEIEFILHRARSSDKGTLIAWLHILQKFEEELRTYEDRGNCGVLLFRAKELIMSLLKAQ